MPVVQSSSWSALAVVARMVRLEALKLDHIYSLQGGAYLVGPKQVRKTIELASRARCRELEQARRDHRRLDKQISELDEPRRLGSPSSHAEVKSLKREKLRLKDHIGELERRQSDSRATAAVTQLGAGGFGKVWLATCMATNREVAIKVRHGEDGQRSVPECRRKIMPAGPTTHYRSHGNRMGISSAPRFTPCFSCRSPR